jgi:hypothetical protein
MISLEGALRTCKVDTAWANRIQSDRFENPELMVCPLWNGFDNSNVRENYNQYIIGTLYCEEVKFVKNLNFNKKAKISIPFFSISSASLLEKPEVKIKTAAGILKCWRVNDLISVNMGEPKFAEDLEKNWAVVAEAIQTILRRDGYPNPYEALKGLTRTNSVINKEAIHNFIETLNISNAIKEELLRITPSNFTGI